MKREAGFAGFLGETFALLSDAGRYVVIFVLVVGGLNAAAFLTGGNPPSGNIGSIGGGFIYTPGMGPVAVVVGLLSAIVSIAASYFLIAQYLEARGLLRDRETRIWAYVGLTILSVIGMMVGFLLLVVPGLILLTRWSAASGFLIGARAGIVESLSASWDATRGNGWAIFFAGFVMLIIASLIGAAIGGISVAMGSSTLMPIVTSFINAFGSALSLAFGIGVYHLVQNDDEALGEVFA
jgi:hypothetical protein